MVYADGKGKIRCSRGAWSVKLGLRGQRGGVNLTRAKSAL